MKQVKTGLERFKELSPIGGAKIENLLKEAPGLLSQVLESPFGDLYQRENLDFKIREAVALTALAIQKSKGELLVHIEMAKTLGYTDEELIEVFSQIVPFAGLPSAIFAYKTLQEYNLKS